MFICQIIRQKFNGRIIPREGGGKFAVEKDFQIARQADGLDGAKTVVGEWLARVDGGGIDLQNGSNAGDEKGLDRFC